MLKQTSRTALVYVAWLASDALALYITLKLWEVVRGVYVALRLNPWGYAAVSNFSIVILGMGALVAMIYLEHLYREAAGRGLLLRRFLQVTAVEVGCAVAALAVLALVP